MSAAEIDAYIARFDDPHRSALEQLRAVILQYLPDGEQGISYAMPAFKVKGKAIAGMAANKTFIGYYPHSGSVIAQLGEQTKPYEGTSGALHFPLTKPIPKRLVKQLIEVKLALAFPEPADVWAEHGISAPARRALTGAGITSVKQLQKVDLADIAELHGMGPKTLKILAELQKPS